MHVSLYYTGTRVPISLHFPLLTPFSPLDYVPGVCLDLNGIASALLSFLHLSPFHLRFLASQVPAWIVRKCFCS